jgi:RimJ/RimL family protein N-acetyltransferase
MEIPTIKTERLVLRGFEPGDLDDLAPIFADADVVRYLAGEPMSREETWREVALHLGHWHLRGYGMWAAIEKATGRCVGRVGIWNPENWPGMEVGWALARDVWGQGYATEGGRTAIAYALDVLDADHIISVIHPDNEASIRVAERLGETFERTDQVHDDIDVVIYGVDRPTRR